MTCLPPAQDHQLEVFDTSSLKYLTLGATLLVDDLPATVPEEMPGSSRVLAVAAGLLACDCSNLCRCWGVACFQEARNDLHDGQPSLSKFFLNLLHTKNNMLLLDNRILTVRQLAWLSEWLTAFFVMFPIFQYFVIYL